MSESTNPFFELLREDRRYKLEAYQFVRESLSYAHEVLDLGEPGEKPAKGEATSHERHLSGQQLCHAIRRYALEQYGLMAKLVLNSWGVNATSDFGEIVYNLIQINVMKKSSSDHREDFNDVYDFDQAFREEFEISMPD